jgi:hypothetical protein
MRDAWVQFPLGALATSHQDVGKTGNPPAWGAGERGFKSHHPDSQLVRAERPRHGPSLAQREKAANRAGPEPGETEADSEVVAAGMQRPALTRKAYVRFIPSELVASAQLRQ